MLSGERTARHEGLHAEDLRVRGARGRLHRVPHCQGAAAIRGTVGQDAVDRYNYGS